METAIDMRPRFSLGRVVITAGAIDSLSEDEVFEGISRHWCGDWGDVCGEDWAENDRSLRDGHRLLSSYRCKESGKRFWVITEHDRSVTTVLLPNE
jgi:hypothetical protein